MKYIVSFLLTLLLAGCLAKAPVTQRNQMIFISPAQEKEMGAKSYNEFLKTAKISTDKAQTERIRRVGARIAKAANKPDYKWEFNLIDEDKVNAWCMPGGKVVVYTGILKLIENDDQLATVMSHEIAHALARHGAERMSQQELVGGLQKLGSVLLNAKAPQYTNLFNTAYGYTAQIGVMLPFSRKQEYEADEIGMHLMHKAGYNIDEAIKFWQNMQKASKGAPPEFLSTHPSDAHRIQKIKEIVAALKRE